MEKSQLIMQPVRSRKTVTAIFTLITAVGVGMLVGGLWKAGKYHGHLADMEIKGPKPPALYSGWSGAGQATAAYIGLATLGAVIASSGLVVLQLAESRRALKTQYQPVVTCAALLDYKLEGVMDKNTKIKVEEPGIKLRLRNLGDSPATFIEICIERLELFSGETKTPLDKFVAIKRLNVDHLAPWKYGDEELIPLATKVNEVGALVNGILAYDPTKGAPPQTARLELRVQVTHRNVMDLFYERRGVFSWSHELAISDHSDRNQKEFLEKSRAALRGDKEENNSVGILLSDPKPLHATVVPNRTFWGFMTSRKPS